METLQEKIIKNLAYNTDIQACIIPNISLGLSEIAEEFSVKLLAFYITDEEVKGKRKFIYHTPEQILTEYKQHLKKNVDKNN